MTPSKDLIQFWKLLKKKAYISAVINYPSNNCYEELVKLGLFHACEDIHLESRKLMDRTENKFCRYCGEKIGVGE